MKTIGLLGGMSYESTITYYTKINELINKELGGLHSAKIILASVDFDEIENYQANNEWQKSGEVLGEYAKSLQLAGAEFIVVCTNTMHKVVPIIETYIKIPILHIADATIQQLKKDNIQKVALLGTKYTMTQDFYKQRIIDQGIEVYIPDTDDIEIVNRIIFDELCHGIIKEESKQIYLNIINKLSKQGAQAVILGCTEIGLLVSPEDLSISCYDTTQIHIEEAVHEALMKKEEH